MPNGELTLEDVKKAVEQVKKDGHGHVLITITDHVILEIEKKGIERREKKIIK